MIYTNRKPIHHDFLAPSTFYTNFCCICRRLAAIAMSSYGSPILPTSLGWRGRGRVELGRPRGSKIVPIELSSLYFYSIRLLYTPHYKLILHRFFPQYTTRQTDRQTIGIGRLCYCIGGLITSTQRLIRLTNYQILKRKTSTVRKYDQLIETLALIRTLESITSDVGVGTVIFNALHKFE